MPGSPDAAEGRELAPPRVHREQRVDERAVLVAGRRMGHQAGGLVDDEHVGVLVDDLERDGLRLDDVVADRRDVELEPGAGRDRVPGADDAAVRGQAAVRDEALDVRAREARRVGHEAVDATARRARGHLDRDALGHVAWPAADGLAGRWPGSRSPNRAATMSSRMPMLIAASATLKA